MEKPLTVGSLFAGIGGFDLGFERSGYEIKWQVEIEPFCLKVLAKHFPNAQRFEDVRNVGKHNLPYVDVICGGFPCQDISVAGKGVGITGARSGLWSEMHRIIGELRPRYVVVENVAALLGRGMGTVLGDLSEIGYDAEWKIIPASAVGAPHQRKRIWIVAYPSEMQSGLLTYSGKERTQRVFTEEIQRFPAFSWCEDVRRVEDLRGRTDIPEPLFRGTRDGIPDWAHRVGSLGNAVVPQIPEWIARQILKYEESYASNQQG